ncbi:MAG TPA: transglutaminase-like domain-containing protein [Candidatus Mediterraneibacter intestinavium]|nr:transglutaminase-like domain-containing protein [Candidatus Mediterraneibacter intestinavium]
MKHLISIWICLLALLLSGCSAASGDSQSGSGSGASGGSGSSGEGARPNDPVVYIPEAPGTSLIGADPLIIDVSNCSSGYVMAKYSGIAEKANIQITGSDGVSYKYFLTPSDSYTPLPLTAGDGTYQIDGYENISGNEYAVLFRQTMDVRLEDELLPFLYPSQYVNFNTDSQAVLAASETVRSASDDLEAVEDIYHFVIGSVVYDEEKAENVTSGYLPDVDETLSSGKGICFDFAALTAAMLRSQDIPTRLEIGYSGSIYHAWISVYLEETGWIDNIIEFRGDGWTRMDPTFAASNENSEKILEYIGDGSNYTTQYIR